MLNRTTRKASGCKGILSLVSSCYSQPSEWIEQPFHYNRLSVQMAHHAHPSVAELLGTFCSWHKLVDPAPGGGCPINCP